MQYTFRLILDVEADVIRDISIDAKLSLLELHKTISSAYGFSTQEMAAFYRTNDDWEQGEEIPLIDMSDKETSNEMKDFILADIFPEANSRLLYIYDFLAMWTFFVELLKIDSKTTSKEPIISFSSGELPSEAPEKHFTTEKISNEIEDEFDSEFEDGYDFEDDINNLY